MTTEELKALVAENARSIRELNKSTREAARQFEKSRAEAEERAKERHLEFKKFRAEEEKRRKAAEKRSKEADRQMAQLRELFTGQWGKLMESLVHAGLPGIFQAAGIAVTRVAQNEELFHGERKIAEVDLLLRNGDEDVAVEVKTTCRPEHIDEHVRRLGKLHEWIPEYAEGRKKLYGAVAALKYTAEADTYAQKKGMYVLKGKGGIFAISNERDFRPVSY